MVIWVEGVFSTAKIVPFCCVNQGLGLPGLEGSLRYPLVESLWIPLHWPPSLSFFYLGGPFWTLAIGFMIWTRNLRGFVLEPPPLFFCPQGRVVLAFPFPLLLYLVFFFPR